jgi:DMSO/TMAO reductase YedYZ molybdopterin-dependent catalytic subunit
MSSTLKNIGNPFDIGEYIRAVSYRKRAKYDMLRGGREILSGRGDSGYRTGVQMPL